MDARPANSASVRQSGGTAGGSAGLSLFADDTPRAAGLPDVGRRGRASPRTSVHTLETNGRAQLSKAAHREESRRDRQATEYFKDRGFHRELSGTAIEPATSTETSFRHGWWAADRALIRAALARGGFPTARLERFNDCGSGAFVHIHKQTHEPRISANTCRDRFCKPCAITKANLIGGNLAERLNARRWDKFAHIVLTLKGSHKPLTEQITRIYEAFKRLRNYKLGTVPRGQLRGRMVKWWGHHVRGGAAFCQATLNTNEASKDFDTWHVHLHIIAACRWIPRDDLASLWKVATGDSSIVWVERIDSREGAAAEVSAYAARGVDEIAKLAPGRLDEMLRAFAGRRLCFTFGEWRGFELTKTPPFNPDDWVTVGRLDELLSQAAGGCARARYLVALLANPPN